VVCASPHLQSIKAYKRSCGAFFRASPIGSKVLATLNDCWSFEKTLAGRIKLVFKLPDDTNENAVSHKNLKARNQ
jgi:hypothetical protein